jgi:hypothetical protein
VSGGPALIPSRAEATAQHVVDAELRTAPEMGKVADPLIPAISNLTSVSLYESAQWIDHRPSSVFIGD